jgi:hypothetical protein
LAGFAIALNVTADCEQTNHNIFEKAPLRGAFSKNLGLVSSQSAVICLK